jgi:hypothetical protein
MKKLLFVIIGVLVFGTVAFAQMPKAKSTKASSKSSAPVNLIERVEGKITTLRKADKKKKDFGSFGLIDASGKKQDFDLIANSHLYSSKSVPIVFSDLKEGDEVLVLYIVTLKGMNDVITVTQSK